MPLATEYRAALRLGARRHRELRHARGSLIKSAVFLHDFVTVPWVHVDIAGSAYLMSDKAVNPKGALGTAVSTLVRLALDYHAGS